MGLILDREQLCDAFGVSDSAITLWEKKGMPVLRKGRGRGMKSLYNFDEVRSWCDQTGHGRGMQALLARFSRVEPPAAPAAAALRTSAPPPPFIAELLALNAEQLEDRELGMRHYPALEAALIGLPAVLRRVELSEAEIDEVVEAVLRIIADELRARGVRDEITECLRTMIAEDRAPPGSWTE
jgi:hypothetical protein